MGPVCRKNINYDDAPILQPEKVESLKEALNGSFSKEIVSYWIERIKIGSPNWSRQLAKRKMKWGNTAVFPHFNLTSPTVALYIVLRC